MADLNRYLEPLEAADRWTYRASRQSAAEPAAWSALALAAHGRLDGARAPARWLADIQNADGSVGVSRAEAEPCWPTALALLAWATIDRAANGNRFGESIRRAVEWSLAARGKSGPRSSKIGHDTTLVGWSWAADTASWLEPTCYFVLALSAAGYHDHLRVVEGRRLIADRLLPSGGANYGNTIVLGQQLVAHIAPSGVALTALGPRVVHALGDEAEARVEHCVRYLEGSIGPHTTPLSLAWACLGLSVHQRRPLGADVWLASALDNPAWAPLPEFERALLLLASAPSDALNLASVSTHSTTPAGLFSLAREGGTT